MPNILFIFSDDQIFETLGKLGLKEAKTPNLECLSEQGARFDRTCKIGLWSGAVCVASRHMLNIGTFLWLAQKAYKTTEKERKDCRYKPIRMKTAGYKTYFTGKWHLNAKVYKCFDVVKNWQFRSLEQYSIPKPCAIGQRKYKRFQTSGNFRGLLGRPTIDYRQ